MELKLMVVNTRKNIITLVAVLLQTVILVGCGGGSATNSTGGETIRTSDIKSQVLSANGSATYESMFISYVSEKAVAVNIAELNKLGIHNFFFWTYGSDTPYTSSTSLLKAVNNQDSGSAVSGYWANWGIYNKGNAIPTANYPIANNPDLTDKLQNSNGIIYAFLEAQVASYYNSYLKRRTNNRFHQAFGSLYFYDPGSDLLGTDLNNGFCSTPPAELPQLRDDSGNNLICTYVPQQLGYSFADFANTQGNFDAFANLGSVNGKNGKPVDRAISVGGFGHNDTFEDIFDPVAAGITDVTESKAINNFVSSAKAIMSSYNINGIDLDYENPSMTHEQSDHYYQLVSELSNALKSDSSKYITVTVLANPSYIDGQENSGTVGFNPNYQNSGTSVLNLIAALPNVRLIQVMTYDFHGVWDYTSGSGMTGFLSNLYKPNNTQANQLFWIAGPDSTIAALQDIKIPLSKVGIGIPAYGRALANIDAGNNPSQPGLFSPITSTTVIPKGDLDRADCDNNITDPFTTNTCNGMFSYNFIVDKMESHGFTTYNPTNDDANVINGTIGYANSWAAPTLPDQLTLIVDGAAAEVNIGGANGFDTRNWVSGTNIYTSRDIANIVLETGLTVQVTNWGTQNASCIDAVTKKPFSFDFNQNTTIHIVSSGNPPLSVTCELVH
jgi:GH18 family chitinase